MIATVAMVFTAFLIIGVPLGRMMSEALGWKSVFASRARTSRLRHLAVADCKLRSAASRL